MMIGPSKDYVTTWSQLTENSIMYPQTMGAFYLRIHFGASGLKETGKRFLNRNVKPLICILLTLQNRMMVIVNLERGVLILVLCNPSEAFSLNGSVVLPVFFLLWTFNGL